MTGKPKGAKEIMESFDALSPEAGPHGFKNLLIAISDWKKAEILAMNFIQGELFSTTSRTFLIGPTGRGKTSFAMAFSVSMAAGAAFLHFDNRGPCRILFIDAEMPLGLCKRRVLEALNRLPKEQREVAEKNLMVLNYDDAMKMEVGTPPLNTIEGLQFIFNLMEEIGGVDFIIFDNLMSLLSGNLKEEEPWKDTLPLVKALTSKNIGQLWLDHTGWDETRGYGSSIKFWLMDTVMLMKNASKTEIDFTLAFEKNRNKTPENAHYFEEVRVSLTDDDWNYSAPTKGGSKSMSPRDKNAYNILFDVITNQGRCEQPRGDMPFVTAVPLGVWREALKSGGVTNKDNPGSERNQWREINKRLMAKGVICIEGNNVSPVRDGVTRRDESVTVMGEQRDVT